MPTLKPILLENEAAFERTLREYVLDNGMRKYRFGGACNFIATVHTLFEDLAKEFNCSDYEVVAVALQEALNASDLPYTHNVEE
jgi:hypothetical protein